MERLESALAKARAARRRNQGNLSDSDVAKNAAKQSLKNWAALPGIEISARTAARRRLTALMGPPESAPYDILRARVLRQMKESGWQSLVVTSPTKACGKTTLSANLAICLARQPELRVILMDFDLRRPALADIFEIPTRRNNIADLLKGNSDFADHAILYKNNLAICANNSRVEHSAELLRSPSTQIALERIKSEWRPDIIIFDTSPMLGSDDNLAFLGNADCALLVGAAGSTTLDQIDTCERELSNVSNVIGTVLTKCRYLNDSYGYGASYY